MSRTISPHAHRHVVASAHEDVARVGGPSDAPDGIFMPCENGEGPSRRISNVKGAKYSVDTARGDHRVVVLVPVVGENLSRHGAGIRLTC